MAHFRNPIAARAHATQFTDEYRGFTIAPGTMGYKFHYYRKDRAEDWGNALTIREAKNAIDDYWRARS